MPKSGKNENIIDKYDYLVYYNCVEGKYCVYAHSIDDVIFYIGCGNPHRPISVQGRTTKWKQIVKENGGVYDTAVLAKFDDRREALKLEHKLIHEYQPKANTNFPWGEVIDRKPNPRSIFKLIEKGRRFNGDLAQA